MRAEQQVAAESQSRTHLIAMLLEQAKAAGKAGASQKVGGRWVDVSWSEILERVKTLSAGLVAWGVKPGDRVAIFGATTLQWLIADLAVSAARAISVPIYASNTPEECRYILNNSESVFLFVDNDEADGKQPGRASRIRARLGDCPTVKKVILFEGAPQGARETTLAELEQAGRSAEPDSKAFDARVAQISPDDHQCFIYTSGTTGDPKGVILTHGSWAFEGTALKSESLMQPDDSVLLFLPMAHSFAQVIKAAWLGMGFKLVFAESVDKLLANLAEAKPTILPSVPRVFEKVYNKVVSDGSSAPGLKGTLFRWAFGLFDQYAEARAAGREFNSVGWSLARKLVFAKVQAALSAKLGGRIRLFISGGAPLSRKIAYFFDLLGFKVLEGYGLTETAAASTVNRPFKNKIGTVGAPLPGVQVKIADDGEILIRGPNIMKGYFKNPSATAEAIDPEGWLHSGDIGEIDGDGYVRITDRKKDIIVTAGGKNVAPQNLENLLKTFPLISQAMVYGDKRKYLTVLICVSEEPAKKLLAERGVTVNSYAELSRRPEIEHVVQQIIDQVNADQPPYNSLKRFALVDQDFSQEAGELTPTLKVKRKFVSAKYKALLDSLYDDKFD